jgi:hypothetical protein
MTVDEIIRIVKANVDRSVILKFGSGEIMAGVILTVDREGFVYDPGPPETRKANPLYWTPFFDIADVRPQGEIPT